MNEIENIQQNINGEIPNEPYEIVRIKNVKNPSQMLSVIIESVTTILENIDLDAEDEKWYEILPETIVKFTEQIEEEDYYRDDFLKNIPSIIDDFQSKNRKKWVWYSSKLTDNGFEIFMLGIFRPIHIPFYHHHGIAQSSIFVESEGVEYRTNALEGVLSYKTWNPDTLELK